ncbi:hypothetical protein [Loigolactobacillus coryniformis]|uniref:Polymerase n=1 Tax=Loigolactobacillus coryniformis TaxID=1610 RepID=A0A5B8TEB8_9LACO|nr:hypothetical protein [Loigolactobacillus coryniformis]QEA52670.1 hypothetical protein FGL77_04675 [Loigolactobacillus coryniformis]
MDGIEVNRSRQVIADIFFILSFMIWQLIVLYSQTTYYSSFIDGEYLQYVRLICLAIAIISEVIRNKFDMSIVAALVILFFVGIIYVRTGNSGLLLDIFVFIYCVRRIAFKKIIFASIVVQSLVILTTILGAKLAVIPNTISIQGNTIRFGLGFQYTTYPSQLYFYLVLMIVYIRKQAISFFEIVVLFFLNYIIFHYTHTRNPFLLVSLTLIVILISKRFGILDFKSRLIQFFLKYTFIIFAILTTTLVYLYSNNPLFHFLNQLFSNRISLGHDGLINYGIPLFGQKIELYGMAVYEMIGTLAQYNYIDSSYIQILVVYGLIFFLFLMAGFTNISKKAVESNKNILSFILFVISIHSMLDPQLIFLWYNPFLMILGYNFNLGIYHDNNPQKFNLL